jgi:hypothetical protein
MRGLVNLNKEGTSFEGVWAEGAEGLRERQVNSRLEKTA